MKLPVMELDRGPRLARRTAPLGLLCLTLFLLLLPLTLSPPGPAVVERADAAAFYLAALSLWHDGDLVCDDGDARRLFREYPGTDNLVLMGEGQGRPVYFGIPLTYPLAATPFVALFGARGMVMLNAALLLATVWMGFAYLRRHNGESLSALFAASYFLLSTAFVYVFWLQAEIFNMACVMAAFFLVERAVGDSEPSAVRRRSPRRLALHAAGSAALLATAGYSKPMLAALALPLLYLLIRARSWRALSTFAASGLLTAALLAAAADALTEQPWPYLAPRVGVDLSNPVDYIERRVAPRWAERSPGAPARQVLRTREIIQGTFAAFLLDATPEFLVGRHGGFLIYMPFAVLCLLFFLLHERRSVFRWLILAAAVLTAVLFVTFVRGYWLGGGGAVGNRLFLGAYPSFLFLVRRIRPSWLTAFGYGAAAIFLGPLLLTPFGGQNLQAHVRNPPFPRLPLEWSVERQLPGYRRISQAGAVFHGRSDEMAVHGEEIWVRGARRVGIHLLSGHQERGFAFDVRNLAPGNEIEICIEEDCRQLAFDDVPSTGKSERVLFPSRSGGRVPRARSSREAYRYRLTVQSAWGEAPRWRGSGEERFYLGAALAFLGSPEDLARDLYDVEWLSVGAPPSMVAGTTVPVPVVLRNSSPHLWPGFGAARVRIAYHWLRENGDPVTWEGRRTDLPAHVAAGGELEIEARVDAPAAAGRYLLAFDLVRERVRWFSDGDGDQAHRVSVEVVAPARTHSGVRTQLGEPPGQGPAM